MELREYLTSNGQSPFGSWFRKLDATAAARVTISIARLELGNTSNTKGVGSGVFELKIDFGPGYRVYFGKDGPNIVILLGGGKKKRQQQDIAVAQELWTNFKVRNKVRD